MPELWRAPKNDANPRRDAGCLRDRRERPPDEDRTVDLGAPTAEPAATPRLELVDQHPPGQSSGDLPDFGRSEATGRQGGRRDQLQLVIATEALDQMTGA